MSNVQFEDYSVQVKTKLKECAVDFLHEIGGELTSRAKRNSRVQPGGGKTKGSFDYKVDESSLNAQVGSPDENALWEEFGTGVYALKGDGRKNPWYIPVKGYTGAKKPTFNGKVTVVYGKDGTAFYKTNGKKGTRALWNAFESSKGLIERVARERFGDLN